MHTRVGLRSTLRRRLKDLALFSKATTPDGKPNVRLFEGEEVKRLSQWCCITRTHVGRMILQRPSTVHAL